MDEYVNGGGTKDEGGGKGLFGLISSLSQKFDGKSQTELLAAIYKEAEKGKRNGTLTNNDLDAFAGALSPFLDEKKRKILTRVVAELKKI